MVRRKRTSRGKQDLKNKGSVSIKSVGSKQASKKQLIEEKVLIDRVAFSSFLTVVPVTNEDLKNYITPVSN